MRPKVDFSPYQANLSAFVLISVEEKHGKALD